MKPNVIHISWHDSGRFYGCYGKREIQTPRIDALAADGALFENYWAAAPVCSPSRTAAMTGRYPQTVGVWGLCHAPDCYSLARGVQHVAHLMRDAGYRCPLIGWQHEATHDRVFDLGFDEVHLNDPMPSCDVVVPFVIDWLRRAKTDGRPFYLQIGLAEAHRPHDFGGATADSERGVYVPPFLRDSPRACAELAQQQGMIRKADRYTGMVLDALREFELERDTLVTVTCDHGVEFPRAKATLYDPGIELPLVMRWPGGGIVGGRRCPWLLSNVDWLPTMLDLIGLPAPRPMNGRSFAGWFDGSRTSSPRDEVHGMFLDQARMVRTATRKLIWNTGPRAFSEAPASVPPTSTHRYPVWELYDLERDPIEARNLSSTRPVVHPGHHAQELRESWTPPSPSIAAEEAAMKERLWRWMEDIGDPLLRGPEVRPWYERAIGGYRAARSSVISA
jgi:arylsulfatase A-like enzyme